MNFSKALTLQKFNEISNSGQSQVCAQDSRVSKFYIAIISSYSHTQRNDGKKYGLIKCRQDLGLEIKNLKNALCKHVNVCMIKSHKNRIIEPFWTCSRLIFNDLKSYSSRTKKLKILKSANFPEIKSYYNKSHKNGIIEA